MDKELIEKMYRTMLKIRTAEESLVELILRKEIKTPCHLYSGEEASATGICSALNESDYVFSNHRGHGHYLAKGGDLKKMMAEIYTKETGCAKGRGGSMHLLIKDKGFFASAPIVSGTVSLALGSALAFKIKGEKGVAVSFFGDGASGEGIVSESLCFAALKKLPIIFACENNLYSTHMPIKEIRPDQPVYKIAEPFGIKTFQIDGNDVLKVYETAKQAVELCREGNGPVFIELLTYRLRGHVGPSDNIQGQNTDIRPDIELEEWKKRDPIKKLEDYISENNILNNEELKSIRSEVQKEVEEAHKFAKESSFPKPEELESYLFKI